jgi:hypothetical protein
MPDNEQAILEDALDNLREATQRLRATENRMLAADMADQPKYRDLFVRVVSALGMTESSFVEARRRVGK